MSRNIWTCLRELTHTPFSGGDEASLDRFWFNLVRKLLSDSYWQFALKMLNTCQRSHASCRVGREGGSPYVPRRLISVGSHPADPRLLETDECDTKPESLSTYAALSYCWGTSGKNYNTTLQNISDHKIRLPSENLPHVSNHD